MKSLLIIFLSLLLTSCGLLRKSKSSNDGYGYGSGGGGGGSSQSDSVVIKLDSIKRDGTTTSSGSGHVNLTSNDVLWFPKPTVNEKIKIITIHNTKVISKSVNMSDGRVVYSIPERMKIRSTYQVLLRISKSKSTISIYDSLEGTVRTSEIPVTQTMEVTLIDPSPADRKSFEIVQDNNAIQIIDDGETYTEWTWNVTPIRIGSSNLKIVVSVIRDGNKKDIVYEDVVKVEKDIPSQISFFWGKYWQWVIGTFLLPLFLWLYKRRKDKKKRKKK